MRRQLKIGLSTILWTAAIGSAVVFSVHPDQAILLWGILCAAAGALTSAMVAGDYIAAETAHYIVDKVKAEREATVDRALSAVRSDFKAAEDRTASRIQSINNAAMRRVAVEVAEAMAEDEPTRIR